MSLFQGMFTRPGPGVAPGAPRKTGFARLWEVLLRDGSAFFRAGALALASALPFFAGMDIALRSGALSIALVSGAVGGLLAAPQLVGLADVILRSLRDEPGYWWHTYRRVWRRNARASLLPGALFGLLFAAQIMGLGAQLAAERWDVPMLVVSALGLLVSAGLFTYTLPQVALVELPTPTILKNALLLFLVSMPQSLAAALLQLAYWLVLLWFWPYTLAAVLFLGLWLPVLCSQLVIYAGLNEKLKIEEGLRESDGDERSGSESNADASTDGGHTDEDSADRSDMP